MRKDAEMKKRIVRAAILGCLPLVLCVIYCAVYGRTIGDIYIPNSCWNDELLYYKQVEGILRSGVPGGYFGYNESRAPFLSFAVWSPVLMVPWVIWGKVFGWNFFAPFLCNLICLMGGAFVFGYLSRPTWCRGKNTWKKKVYGDGGKQRAFSGGLSVD